MTGSPLLRGRRKIAAELGVSERTVYRMVANGLLNVVYEPAVNNHVMVLDTWQPIGLAAEQILTKLSADRTAWCRRDRRA